MTDWSVIMCFEDVSWRGRRPDARQARARKRRAAAESNPPARKRTLVPPEARRAAILAAALEEFTARGYEGARLDDVAKRAGVAKGTIYLYFADKETLFQELVRSMVNPVLGTLEAVRDDRHSGAHAGRGHCSSTFVREIYGTRRKDIIRLILSEGPRFPAIGEFYHREVIARVLGDHASAAAARGRARRDSRTCARAFPAADRRAGAGRHHVERAVRQVRAARRRRDDARAYRTSCSPGGRT